MLSGLAVMIRELDSRWIRVANPPAILPRIAQVWSSPVEDTQWVSMCHGLLGEDEKERARRFVKDEDRARFTAGRGLLRLLLGKVSGTEPAALALYPDDHGKLRLPSPGAGISFNITHSGDSVLCVLTREGDIGVDVELVREVEDLAATGSFCLAERERQWAFAIADSRCHRFFTLWTRKEAVVKAAGKGLSLPLKEIDVLGGTVTTQGKREWYLSTFVPAAGYIGALATSIPVESIMFLEPDLSAPFFSRIAPGADEHSKRNP
jgi:4'-phosphopantetheinyl transferase